MTDLRLDVIAIGSLARNKYWNEKTSVREEYATATLVRSGEAAILVDPGWPAEVLRAALYYRAGLEPAVVTHVFLTHFDPAHRRGIALFPKATWWMYEEEIRWEDDELPPDAPERKILARFEAAPERLAPGVDLYPTVGHTPGHASLLVCTAVEGTLLAGDAVLTRDHFEHGDLGEAPYDLARAKETLRDLVEAADAVVPGHDNLFSCRAGPRLM